MDRIKPSITIPSELTRGQNKHIKPDQKVRSHHSTQCHHHQTKNTMTLLNEPTNPTTPHSSIHHHHHHHHFQGHPTQTNHQPSIDQHLQKGDVPTRPTSEHVKTASVHSTGANGSSLITFYHDLVMHFLQTVIRVESRGKGGDGLAIDASRDRLRGRLSGGCTGH